MEGVVNSDNINMLLFMLLLGGLISLMMVLGVMCVFVVWVECKCKDCCSVKVLMGLMVFVFFIDDFFYSLFVGVICCLVMDCF